MMGLNHNSKLPRFTVSREDLGRVSNMTDSLNLRDERSVATRMESVELSMRKVQDTLVSFQGPKVQGKEVQRGGGAPPLSVPILLVNIQEVTSFAGVAAKAAGPPQQQPSGRRRVQAGRQAELSPD